jgi:hypothetical protein
VDSKAILFTRQFFNHAAIVLPHLKMECRAGWVIINPIGGVGAELPDWVGVAVGGDADHMHVGMNIDSGRVWIDDAERR